MKIAGSPSEIQNSVLKRIPAIIIIPAALRLIDPGIMYRGEVKAEIFGKIKFQIKKAVPVKILFKGGFHIIIRIVNVPDLLFQIISVHICPKRNSGWANVKIEILDEAQPRRIHPFNRFKGLDIFWPGIEVIRDISPYLPGIIVA